MDGRERVADLARKVGLAQWADQIAEIALPSARILLDDGPGDLLGARLGGHPAMPSRFDWPIRPDGRGLAFIAQIRLDDVGRLGMDSSLPDTGLLSFFYDAEDQPWGFELGDRDRWRVIWFNDLDGLEDRLPPEGPAHNLVFTPHGVRYRTQWTLPDAQGDEVAQIIGPGFPTNAITGPRYDAYFELSRRLSGDPDSPTHVPIHRFLGHPDDVQNPMPAECETLSRGLSWETPKDPDIDAELKRGGREWRLLLQVDSDDKLGTEWGDTGRIYYWIKQGDAAARAFDRAWVILQCS